MNPTNLRNRAVDWETDVIQIFRNHPELKEFSSERETLPAESFPAAAGGGYAPCLQVTARLEVAPGHEHVYGADHGFGWNVGEPIAAQRNIAAQALITMVISRASAAGITWDANKYLAGVWLIANEGAPKRPSGRDHSRAWSAGISGIARQRFLLPAS